MIKKLLNKCLSDSILKKLLELSDIFLDRYSKKSYSQEGEDMILDRMFENQNEGFYVDVGAHHPKRFSNTYHFYRKGWRGINIDAMPGSMVQFNKMRPRDINIEQPISDCHQVLDYYIFNEPALNGFSEKLSKERDGRSGYKIVGVKKLETKRLDELLDSYAPQANKIDFLSIDVEGYDLNVLRSLDLGRYRPSVILVEVLRTSLLDINKSDVCNYLLQFGYEVYAKSVNTVIFKAGDQ